METYEKLILELLENEDNFEYIKLLYRITGITNSYDAYDFLADVKKWDI